MNVFVYQIDGTTSVKWRKGAEGAEILRCLGRPVDLRLPDFIEDLPVVAIKDSAFRGLRRLRRVKLPRYLTSVEWEAFKDCDRLREVALFPGLKRIGFRAFEGCSSLASLKTPRGLEYIGTDAFRGCSRLAEVAIAEGTTAIGACAFGDCANLRKLSLPGTLTSIGVRAFENCANLRAVKARAGIERVGEGAFDGCALLSREKLARVLRDGGVVVARARDRAFSIRKFGGDAGLELDLRVADEVCRALAALEAPRDRAAVRERGGLCANL